MNRLIVFCIFILCSRILCQAQQITGSPYSVYGVGDIRSKASSLNRALGGTGIAIRDSLNLNHVNPAGYTSIVSPISQIYEMGFFVESNTYKTNLAYESKTFASITNLNMWLRPKKWWALAAGVAPFSDVNYNIKALRDFGDGKTNVNYKGSGGLTNVYWSNSFDPVKNLSIGINSSLIFGALRKDEVVEISSSADLHLENKILANQFNLDAGSQYKIPIRRYAIVLGAIADKGFKLRGRKNWTLYKVTDASTDTLGTGEGSNVYYDLPGKYGFGFSAQSPRSILAADFVFQPWSKADFGEGISYQDTRRYSLGYAYSGHPKSENYFAHISFRSGVYFQNHYFTLDNTLLENWGFSLGIGLPVQEWKAALNLTYAYDRLGTTSNGLILEKSSKFMFDITFRDIWGIKRRYD